MTWLIKIFDNIVVPNSVIRRVQRITWKQVSTVVIPALLVFFIAAVLLYQNAVPGRNAGYYVLVGLSIAAGLLLYIGGLIVTLLAFKKAHDLFRQDDGWRESVAA